MKVDALTQLGAQIARAAPSLTFPGEGDLASRLTLGQIIKGRVLRSYDGQRYLVDFGGDRRVVDSTVPLRPDEVFHGRVVGLGEQVQLQKLAAGSAEAPMTESVPLPAGPRDGTPLAELFARYRAEVPAAQLDAASPVVARLPQPELAALGALVLAKLGLPLEPSLIRALHARLAGAGAADARSSALHLDTAAPAATRLESAVPALASALAGAMVDQQTVSTASGQGGGDSRRGPRDPAARILNLQTRGAVAHSLGLLPLLVDGRLVELELALFDEGGSSGDDVAPAPRHRQIVIALDTETLGHVEVRARIAGTRMDLSLATESSAQTLALSMHSGRLSEDLRALGFEVDSLAYLTQPAAATSAPVQCTVEHLITPGSVSRWV